MFHSHSTACGQSWKWSMLNTSCLKAYSVLLRVVSVDKVFRNNSCPAGERHIWLLVDLYQLPKGEELPSLFLGIAISPDRLEISPDLGLGKVEHHSMLCCPLLLGYWTYATPTLESGWKYDHPLDKNCNVNTYVVAGPTQIYRYIVDSSSRRPLSAFAWVFSLEHWGYSARTGNSSSSPVCAFVQYYSRSSRPKNLRSHQISTLAWFCYDMQNSFTLGQLLGQKVF